MGILPHNKKLQPLSLKMQKQFKKRAPVPWMVGTQHVLLQISIDGANIETPNLRYAYITQFNP